MKLLDLCVIDIYFVTLSICLSLSLSVSVSLSVSLCVYLSRQNNCKYLFFSLFIFEKRVFAQMYIYIYSF